MYTDWGQCVKNVLELEEPEPGCRLTKFKEIRKDLGLQRTRAQGESSSQRGVKQHELSNLHPLRSYSGDNSSRYDCLEKPVSKGWNAGNAVLALQ